MELLLWSYNKESRRKFHQPQPSFPSRTTKFLTFILFYEAAALSLIILQTCSYGFAAIWVMYTRSSLEDEGKLGLRYQGIFIAISTIREKTKQRMQESIIILFELTPNDDGQNFPERACPVCNVSLIHSFCTNDMHATSHFLIIFADPHYLDVRKSHGRDDERSVRNVQRCLNYLQPILSTTTASLQLFHLRFKLPVLHSAQGLSPPFHITYTRAHKAM